MSVLNKKNYEDFIFVETKPKINKTGEKNFYDGNLFEVVFFLFAPL